MRCCRLKRNLLFKGLADQVRFDMDGAPIGNTRTTLWIRTRLRFVSPQNGNFAEPKQRFPPAVGTYSGNSVVRRPISTYKKSRLRALFAVFTTLQARDATGWLGRLDSNQGMA